MAVSTGAFFLQQPPAIGGMADVPYMEGLYPENPPAILWGQGTPGAIVPFTVVNKGSLYMSTNQTDDTTCVYMKVDEGGDANDWVKVAGFGMGEITVESLETNALSNILVLPQLIDISASDADYPLFHAVAALTITEAGLIWVEGSADDTGTHEGDVSLGTTSGGTQIVAATKYGDNQAAGAYQALTIVSGAMAAGSTLWVGHDQSTGAGTCYVQIKYDLNS